MHERVDRRLQKELQVVMQDDYVPLLDAYLEDSERQLEDMLDAWQVADLPRLRASAHSLKGASRNVGASVVAALCGRVEQGAEEDPSCDLGDTLTELRDELSEVQEIFRRRSRE